MAKWNDIPFDPNAEPEVKALEFDLQLAENQADAPEDKSNPFSEENFPGPDRRK